jgi:hypothetical protein
VKILVDIWFSSVSLEAGSHHLLPRAHNTITLRRSFRATYVVIFLKTSPKFILFMFGWKVQVGKLKLTQDKIPCSLINVKIWQICTLLNEISSVEIEFNILCKGGKREYEYCQKKFTDLWTYIYNMNQNLSVLSGVHAVN